MSNYPGEYVAAAFCQSDRPRSLDGEDRTLPLRPGQSVGRYQIVSCVGTDLLGHLYSARVRGIGVSVAIREFFPRELACRTDGPTVNARSQQTSVLFGRAYERFVDEGTRLAAQPRVPFLSATLEVVAANGTAYLVQDSIHGMTLETRLIESHALAPAEIDRLLAALLQGLEQIHGAGGFHCGVRPDKIVLRDCGIPVLTDFGAMRAAIGILLPAYDELSESYLAPEAITGAECGPWTDIYGLAAVMYRAITTSPPPSVVERTRSDTQLQLRDRAPEGFAPGFLEALERGLELSRNDRPQSIAEWRHLLWPMKACEGGRSARPQRRWPVRAAVGIALTSALVAAGYVGAKTSLLQEVTTLFEAEASEVENNYREGDGLQLEALQRPRRSRDAIAAIEEEMRRRDIAQAMAKADAAITEDAANILRTLEVEASILAQLELAAETERRAEERSQAQAEARAVRAAEAKANEEREAAERDLAGASAMESSLNLAVVERRHIQVALRALGFDPIWIDGLFGPRSRAMIATWQKDHDLPATGFVTSAQYLQLLREGAAEISAFDATSLQP